MERYPENSRKLLLVPLGAGENRLLKFDSIDEWPHALVGGATKSGKTTLLHGWICALLLKNRPRMLKLVLIDLKGGVEFTRYKNVPHMMRDGFVKDKADVVPMLEKLQYIMEDRLEKFEQEGGVQNVAAWNYQHRPRLYRIVVFVDELASIMLEPDLKKDAERLLADLGARGRAPGIHLVIATQRPENSVVSGRIKGNLDARFGFRVPDGQSSMVILDDWSASQFPSNTPRGRFIFKFGNDRRELQAPLIKPAQIAAIVQSVTGGDAKEQEEAQRISPDEIFEVALHDLGGDFTISKLYQIFKGRVSQGFLSKLGQSHEGKVFEVNGDLYELQPSSGPIPRRLVPVREDTGGDIGENAASQEHYTSGEPQTTSQMTLDDIFRVALHDLGGDFTRDALYDALGGDVTQATLNAIGQEWEGRAVDVDGTLYLLEPAAGRRPRRLIPMEVQ
jgi:DNA segregation ATPase FtsK/SpoIIIE-like protein